MNMKDPWKKTLKNEIPEIKLQDVVKMIREGDKSEFAVFLSFELRDRYESRPREEKHLTFEQWRKILMLRDETEEDHQKKQKRFTKRSFKTPNEPVKKNKDYYKNKNIVIPDEVKKLSTTELLRLRYAYFYDEFNSVDDREVIYAELANRPHIPTNKTQRREQKERGTTQKNGAKKKAIRSHKSHFGGKGRW